MQIGADIECFLRDSCDHIINAADHIKYSKQAPYKKQKIKIHYDNILAEFSIPICNSGKEFVVNMTNGLYLLEKLSNPYKMDFTAASTINDLIAKNENATENGCNDETDAYSLSFNTEIESFIKNSRFRTCGGHIHIGFDDDNLIDPVIKPLFVYMLDLFLGIPSIILDRDITQIIRRQAFGKAGAFRPKNYGIEYRVLSSWWVTKPEYISLVYNIVEFVYYEMQEKIWEKFWSIKTNEDNVSYNCFGYDVDLIKNTINNCDIIESDKLINFISNFMPNDLVEQINQIRKMQKLTPQY